ncbi:phosphoribosylformylglycinamidine synthase subunit PurS [Weissella diestrammenae]|uniref:Phosphoribosylformylglycinamidine synthase subunit PurS n=1 Tax=Weissella diestrammenae TaxID=1162633 RepID=A0A7G9T7M6_9LACO|nr:phosphoribosylformylglycinamidine synthase subunit PurS [Weissella diestrammenae]MCM0583398.1 phosphoribosylformylglycinamidine synthase subunit PurS [Weissella diestrammenae]QNN76101.1 phosphoribosylformylglycinamidine synthase subunit PurS [Weissella diestrammenae]
MYLAKIYVTYKQSILDPQGEVIKSALHRLDYQTVERVNQGKYFEIMFAADNESAAAAEVKAFTEALLINHNTETYRFELAEV